MNLIIIYIFHFSLVIFPTSVAIRKKYVLQSARDRRLSFGKSAWWLREFP